MMTLPQIAAVLVDRRNRMNPIVMIGEMQIALGEEGFSLALERRWLVPDPSTGHLLITDNQGIVDELREMANQAQYKVGDSVMMVDNGQTFTAVVQAIRPDGSYVLSYPDGKKPTAARDYYKQDELSPVARPEVNPAEPNRIRRHVPLPSSGQPEKVAGGAPGPRGPGIG